MKRDVTSLDLQVQSWPDKPALGEENWPGDFFKSKLSFQIQHGVFRSVLIFPNTGELRIY